MIVNEISLVIQNIISIFFQLLSLLKLILEWNRILSDSALPKEEERKWFISPVTTRNPALVKELITAVSWSTTSQDWGLTAKIQSSVTCPESDWPKRNWEMKNIRKKRINLTGSEWFQRC